MPNSYLNRRHFIHALAAGSFTAALPYSLNAQPQSSILKKIIPSSGEEIPALGIGSWINFNVGRDPSLRQNRTKVLKAFFEGGGAMIDSSPMYGSSEEVIGHMLKELGYPKNLFGATKVWTNYKDQGLTQIKQSMKLWGVKKFELLQVHNLVAWKAHLKLLQTLKQEGLVRYIGITTSHGRRHDDFLEIMKSEPLDFVQLTYNIENRAAEKKLLPFAKDKGIAVIANRPFSRGHLIDRYSSHPLPGFAKEINCTNWPQFLLKFIISHPALTVAIPATSQVEHVKENLSAGLGPMPDMKMRAEMAKYCASL